ncbi:MAG: helix-turn-helix transcriptional regulator [Candidatus Ventricola sp.]
MELSEKLQTLRTRRGLTQEQLAEQLFVSRTAVSKWESGRGAPSIDSLRAISRFFGVTIDELLSGEELISLAQEERQAEQARTRSLLLGVLDLSALLLIVLPLCGQPVGDAVLSVSLLATDTHASILLAVHVLLLVTLAALGVARLVLLHAAHTRWDRRVTAASLAVGLIAALDFAAAREPYVCALLILLLAGKLCLALRK